MPTKLDARSRELLGELKSRSGDQAAVRAAGTAVPSGGGGLFSRLRETFSGR